MRLQIALLCATALGLFASSALAQRPSGRGPERRAQMLFTGITLTPEQQAKVDSILAYYREQMPSLTAESPPDSATREEVRGMFHPEVEDIRGVVRADHQKDVTKNRARME